MTTTPVSRAQCSDCGTSQLVEAGRLRPHWAGGRPCPGSRRATSPAAFGPVLGQYALSGVPCCACGQPARSMTVHRGCHAVWPCGDVFAVASDTAGFGEPAREAVIPLPRGARRPVPMLDQAALTG